MTTTKTVHAAKSHLSRVIEQPVLSHEEAVARGAEHADCFPSPHCDLFDRLLVAHVVTADLALATDKPGFNTCGVRRLW